MKKVLLLIFGLLFLCCCSKDLCPCSSDEEDGNKDEEKEKTCWTCVQREILHNRSGNMVSNTVLTTIETCNASEKSRLESISSNTEYDCITFSSYPYKQCGNRHIYYSCVKK
jgi:hypothetical protein